MWLNDKEEEEVNFDWSDRNTNMTAKKDNYSVSIAVHILTLMKRVQRNVIINHFLWAC